jgi:hypothetical protein
VSKAVLKTMEKVSMVGASTRTLAAVAKKDRRYKTKARSNSTSSILPVVSHTHIYICVCVEKSM